MIDYKKKYFFYKKKYLEYKRKKYLVVVILVIR